MPLWVVVLSILFAVWCFVRAIAAERQSYVDPMYPVTGARELSLEDAPPAKKTGWRFTMGTGKRATVVEYEGMDESAALTQFMKDQYDYGKITKSEAM